MDSEHNFAYDLDRFVQGRLERHVEDGADAVAPFDCKEGRADRTRYRASILDAYRPCQHI